MCLDGGYPAERGSLFQISELKLGWVIRITYRSNGSDGKARSITGSTEEGYPCRKVSLP
jgi:hypothetical protein